MNAKRKAFTLVELLVVIVILGLLLVLLLPSLQGAWKTLKQTQCAVNLNRIGRAYGVRVSDERLGRVGSIRVYGWPGFLLPYLEDNADALICPEHENPMSALPIEEMLQSRAVGSNWEYYIKLDGPYVAKMSDSQYQAAKAAGYIEHGMRLMDIYSGYAPRPGDDPNVVWYCIEELEAGTEWMQPGNPAHDYEDVRMRVTDRGDGSIDLYFELGSGHVDISIETVGGVPLDPPVVIRRGWPRSPRSAGPFEGFTGRGAATSYGMNSQVGFLRSGGGKVLALDYERIVAQSTDLWADWDDDEDGVPIFARHPGGVVNVLFVDGSVKTMDPSEIDPIASWIAKTCWDP